ncbi:NAD(P)-dependent oxidoreductase [Salicibibacter kimchii]|uniref:NAD-dependent epimerase/dehydratase family protein n=1 Tax=Salicibibacter kimchii TaxID=2099786 RepID=A0A345BVR5_9BACI|nr:NAD(P)H-binding protein [Salicibibacter kimchii]AXF55046.1 NAD-dependent epimerase/dehydratase family protein [Salicibibacter kimchii]
MKILILGATGRVGTEITRLALADQHDVKVLVRQPEMLAMNRDQVTVVQGNVLNRTDLSEAMHNVDIVISALNTDKNDTLSRSAPLIIQEMYEQGLQRFIMVGTAGILNSRTERELYRFQSRESKRRSTTAAEDHLGAYRSLKESGLKWTIVCPTALINGGSEGNYRVEKDYLPENGKRISVGDTAAFTYSLLDLEKYIHVRVGIAY